MVKEENLTGKSASDKGTKKEARVSEKKLSTVKEMVGYILNNNTITISSMRGTPSSQFQRIRKILKARGVIIKVVKKNVMAKAIEASKKAGIESLAQYLEEGSAILFSQLDPFELAGILADSMKEAKARAGQRAPYDIMIESGPTDIPAGPMITELSNAGLKVGVDSGRISIRDASTIVKRDEKISENVANILSMMNIFPFRTGLEPIAAYDSREKSVLTGININKKEMLDNMKNAHLDAFALAVSLVYPAKGVIGMIIARAARTANAIFNLQKSQTQTTEQNQTGG